jgi:hypothetical protein
MFALILLIVPPILVMAFDSHHTAIPSDFNIGLMFSIVNGNQPSPDLDYFAAMYVHHFLLLGHILFILLFFSSLQFDGN